jgi:hypothetical protein
MDEHFCELFARYEALGGHQWVQPALRIDPGLGETAAQLA